MDLLLLIGAPIYAVIVTMALLGNSFILVVITRNKKLHHPVFMFLANQSLSDLIFTILSFGDAAYAVTGSWTMGLFFCKLQGAIMQVLYTISILSLVAVAVERYMEICLLSTVKTTLVYCVRVCLLIAVLSLVVCSPMFYSFTETKKRTTSSSKNNIPNNSSKNDTTFEVTIECTTNNWSWGAELIFNLIHTLVAFLLPLVILVVTHSRIYAKLTANQQLQVKRLTSTESTSGASEGKENYGSIAEQHKDAQSFSQVTQIDIWRVFFIMSH